ncbi:Ras and Rab interactor 1 [Striga asiatica]|uniref:Ras and Rab interactor 1 n=1 Tax=Striga asiatica TaxID=4170 RepID=A0A5A7Q4Q6_STRAF|nr:Ras and Rab interactor 1 [Striga asiatica]
MEGMLHRKSMLNSFHGFWKLSQVRCSYLRSSILRLEQEVRAVQEVREVVEGWKIEHRLPVSSCYRISPYNPQINVSITFHQHTLAIPPPTTPPRAAVSEQINHWTTYGLHLHARQGLHGLP